MESQGGYVAEGFGFDLNGFAGAPGPRFGERSGCSQPQPNPIEYPFTSYGGDVTFTEPSVGNRVIDFNTEECRTSVWSPSSSRMRGARA